MIHFVGAEMKVFHSTTQSSAHLHRSRIHDPFCRRRDEGVPQHNAELGSPPVVDRCLPLLLRPRRWVQRRHFVASANSSRILWHIFLPIPTHTEAYGRPHMLHRETARASPPHSPAP